ncbi:MAG: MAPEG family protein [Myxococcota bacterium]|nr:MAPEG family protein [Myxococcota bacterium]
MNEDQRFVAVGMAGAAIFSVLFVAVGLYLFDSPVLGYDSPGDRIAYALRCDFWAGFALLAGIARVAGQRFFSNEIDGSVPAEGHSLQVNRTYIQNTTEQIILLLMAHAALSLVVSSELLRLIPILVALFLIGRVTFWAGYLRSAPARAFGFAATFYPTVAVFVFVAFRLVTQ